MKQTTIQQLNDLNRTFYQETAAEFDVSRQSFWSGWYKLKQHVSELSVDQLKVLDVGCGNGRFGQFLSQTFPNLSIAYTGIDSSAELLERAEQTLPSLPAQTAFQHIDLIDQLLAQQEILSGQTFDLVVAFGLFHHIPSSKLRSALFQQLSELLAPNGLLAISFWQFLNSTKLRERTIDPATVQIDPGVLEENDFILDWRAGEKPAYRYCHYTNNQEEIALLKQIDLHVIDEFFADGATNNLNHYLLLKKS